MEDGKSKRSSRRLKRSLVEDEVEEAAGGEDVKVVKKDSTKEMKDGKDNKDTVETPVKKRKRYQSLFNEEQKLIIVKAVKSGLTTRKHDDEARDKLCQQLDVDPSRLRHWINNHRASILEGTSLTTTPSPSTPSSPPTSRTISPKTLGTARPLTNNTHKILQDLTSKHKLVSETKQDLKQLSGTFDGFKQYVHDQLHDLKSDIIALTAELVYFRDLQQPKEQ